MSSSVDMSQGAIADLTKEVKQGDRLALISLCIALISVSFAPIFIKLSELELGANATVFNRLFFFFIIFGFGRFCQRRISPTEPVKEIQAITRQQWLLLIGVGAVAISSLVLWAISLQYTTVAKSMLLNNLTPIFTSLGSWLWLDKKFDRRFLIGMTIALVGAIALGLEDINGSAGTLLGDSYALLSAVFLGLYFLIVEQLRSRFSATTILLWRCGIGSLLLLPLVFLIEGQLFPQTLNTWLAVLGLALISEGLGQRLLAQSMDKLSSSFVSLFLLLEPMVSALLAWCIFNEALNLITGIAFIIVFSGIYLAKTSQAALAE